MPLPGEAPRTRRRPLPASSSVPARSSACARGSPRQEVDPRDLGSGRNTSLSRIAPIGRGGRRGAGRVGFAAGVFPSARQEGRLGTRRRPSASPLLGAIRARHARRRRVLARPRRAAARRAPARADPPRHRRPRALPAASRQASRPRRRSRRARGSGARDDRLRRAGRDVCAAGPHPARERPLRRFRRLPEARRRGSTRLCRGVHAHLPGLRLPHPTSARGPCARRRHGQRRPGAARGAASLPRRRDRHQSACARVHGAQRRDERLHERRGAARQPLRGRRRRAVRPDHL